MMREVTARILVVGAGASGLAFALTCAYQGIQVRIIEKRANRSSIGKATGVAQGTWEQLKRFGILISNSEGAIPMNQINFYDEGNVVAKVAIPKINNLQPAYLYPQAQLELRMEEELRLKGVEVDYGTSLVAIHQNADYVRVSLEKQKGEVVELDNFDWVIGADGAHSDVRTMLNLSFHGKDYPEEWSVSEAKTLQWPQEVQAQLYLDANGKGIFFSTPSTNVVQAIVNAPEAGMQLKQKFTDAVIQYERNFHVSVRRVLSPRVEKVWLIGDAAHVQSPVGGQGLNLAIWDGISLADALVKRDFSIEQRLISRAKRVLRFTDFDYRMLSTKVWILRQLRNLYWGLASAYPKIVKWFFKMISGVW